MATCLARSVLESVLDSLSWYQPLPLGSPTGVR